MLIFWENAGKDKSYKSKLKTLFVCLGNNISNQQQQLILQISSIFAVLQFKKCPISLNEPLFLHNVYVC